MNDFSTLQCYKSDTHLVETVLLILNFDLFLVWWYAVQYTRVILGRGHGSPSGASTAGKRLLLYSVGSNALLTSNIRFRVGFTEHDPVVRWTGICNSTESIFLIVNNFLFIYLVNT